MVFYHDLGLGDASSDSGYDPPSKEKLMGRWGHGILDDDSAFDVKGHFDDAVTGGRNPTEAAAGLMETEVAREILDEFDEEERDEMFWEESAGLLHAVAVLQLEHGVVQDDVRHLALEAVEHELQQLHTDDVRVEVLRKLEARLRS